MMNIIKYTILRIMALIAQIIGAIAIIIAATSTITNIGGYDVTLLFAIGDVDEEGNVSQEGGRTPEEIEALKAELGIDRNPVETFFEYILNLFTRGDFGNSWYGENEPVSDLYVDAFVTTARVFGLGILIFTILAVILGILAARRMDGSLDKNIRFSTSLFYSFPPYVLGTLLIFGTENFLFSRFREKVGSLLESQFGLSTRIDPMSDLFDTFMDAFLFSAKFELLPIVSVVLIYTGFQFRLVRIYMSDVLNQNYIRTAYAKGLHERTILLKHGLRNALPELITSIATTFPVAFSGVVVLEKVFEIPGSGLLLINSGLDFNWPLLIGGAVIFTTLNAIILTVTDLIVNTIDPQLRLK